MKQHLIPRDEYEALLTDKIMLDVEHSEGKPEAIRMSALIDRLNLQIAALKRENERLRADVSNYRKVYSQENLKSFADEMQRRAITL